MRETNARIFLVREEGDLGKVYDYAEEQLTHGDLKVKIEPYVTKRTNLQNDLWWAYMTEIGRQTSVTKEQAAVIAKAGIGFVEAVNFMGRMVPLAKSTKDLTTKEMSEAIREVEIWASEIGITLYAPDYREEALR